AGAALSFLGGGDGGAALGVGGGVVWADGATIGSCCESRGPSGASLYAGGCDGVRARAGATGSTATTTDGVGTVTIGTGADFTSTMPSTSTSKSPASARSSSDMMSISGTDPASAIGSGAGAAIGIAPLGRALGGIGGGIDIAV